MLASLPQQNDPKVLIGFSTSDDAGVYLLTPDCALVQTVDFFTPIVDDPFLFGAIAAANALSDVYAMGGKPITSLSILAWPASGDFDDLAALLKGGAEKMKEANCSILGGHSINDEEPKFGYAVTGLVHPDHVKPNAGARPGDSIVLTKKIGTGIISTALKKGIAEAAHVESSIASMCLLNRAAAEVMSQLDVHAATDVTGFGLIGHAREVAAASRATLVIDHSLIQFLPGAVDYSRRGAIPGGLRNNREYCEVSVELDVTVPEEIANLLYDPQTSGGLLLTMSDKDAAIMERLYPGAYRIGIVTEQQHKAILVK